MAKGFKDTKGKFHPIDKKKLKFGKDFKEFSREEDRRHEREQREAEELRKKKGIIHKRPFVVVPTEKQKAKNKILEELKDKGFKLTTEIGKDPDDPDDEGTELTTIEITEKQTLDGVNDKRSALEIMDFITGTTENERMRFDIDTDNKLSELEDAGKIKIENGVWKKVT